MSQQAQTSIPAFQTHPQKRPHHNKHCTVQTFTHKGKGGEEVWHPQGLSDDEMEVVTVMHTYSHKCKWWHMYLIQQSHLHVFSPTIINVNDRSWFLHTTWQNNLHHETVRRRTKHQWPQAHGFNGERFLLISTHCRHKLSLSGKISSVDYVDILKALTNNHSNSKKYNTSFWQKSQITLHIFGKYVNYCFMKLTPYHNLQRKAMWVERMRGANLLPIAISLELNDNKMVLQCNTM